MGDGVERRVDGLPEFGGVDGTAGVEPVLYVECEAADAVLMDIQPGGVGLNYLTGFSVEIGGLASPRPINSMFAPERNSPVVLGPTQIRYPLSTASDLHHSSMRSNSSFTNRVSSQTSENSLNKSPSGLRCPASTASANKGHVVHPAVPLGDVVGGLPERCGGG